MKQESVDRGEINRWRVESRDGGQEESFATAPGGAIQTRGLSRPHFLRKRRPASREGTRTPAPPTLDPSRGSCPRRAALATRYPARARDWRRRSRHRDVAVVSGERRLQRLCPYPSRRKVFGPAQSWGVTGGTPIEPCAKMNAGTVLHRCQPDPFAYTPSSSNPAQSWGL